MYIIIDNRPLLPIVKQVKTVDQSYYDEDVMVVDLEAGEYWEDGEWCLIEDEDD